MKVFKLCLFLICLLATAAAFAQPANNDCSGAINMAANTDYTGDVNGATGSSPTTTCTGSATKDIWYKFYPNYVSMNAIVLVTGSSGFDPVVEIFDNSCTGTVVACGYANGNGKTARISFTPSGSYHMYYIRVYHSGGTPSTNTFSIKAMYDNNECGTHVPTIPTTGAVIQGNTSGMTQTLSPLTCNSKTASNAKDAWYYLGYLNGTYRLSVQGSANFDPVIDVRTGACNGTNYTCADLTATGGYETAVITQTGANQVYFRVYDYNGHSSTTVNDSTTFQMRCQLDCVPVITQTAPDTGITLGTQAQYSFAWTATGSGNTYTLKIESDTYTSVTSPQTKVTPSSNPATGPYKWWVVASNSCGKDSTYRNYYRLPVLTPTSTWQQTDTIDGGSANLGKVYFKVSMTAGNTYIFTTCNHDHGHGAGGGYANYGAYNTWIEVMNSSFGSFSSPSGCNLYNGNWDCGGSGNSSYYQYMCTSTADYVVQVTCHNIGVGCPGEFKLGYRSASGPGQPSAISGNTTVCPGTVQSYSVTSTAGIRFDWTFPPGWTQLTGDTTNSITVLTSGNSGNISVTPAYSLCDTEGTARTLHVDVTVPSDTLTADMVDGDFLWSGVENTKWADKDNWLVLDDTVFIVPSIFPDSSKNVFILNYGSCGSNQPRVKNATASAHNIFIDSTKTLRVDSIRTLRVFGNFTNNGTFTCDSGTVVFKGDTLQTIGGASRTTFKHLTINNSGEGVELIDNPITVNGALTLTDGVLTTSVSTLLSLSHGATSSAGSSGSYVNGPMLKTGNTAFSFPVGKEGNVRPIYITAPGYSTDSYLAEYFKAGQNFGTATDTTITGLSTCEYWMLARSNDSTIVSVKLGWDTSSCNIIADTLVRIAEFDGVSGIWRNRGAINLTGNTTAGTITTSDSLLIYGALTLANSTELPGSSPYNPIEVAPASRNFSTLIGTTQWFLFTPDSSSTIITVTFSDSVTSATPGLVDYITLYKGSPDSLVLISTATRTSPYDSVLSLHAGNLVAGDDYRIVIGRFVPGIPIRFDVTVIPTPTSTAASACENCIGSFRPEQEKKYIVSAWVKEGSASPTKTSYTFPKLTVKYTGITDSVTFSPSGIIIDGWQRIEGGFTIPEDATDINIKLKCSSGTCYFDDVRVFPFDGSMKSYVYDPITLRLAAELDERNYATLYEYDEEGKLTRVKKETEKGIMTIKESKNSSVKRD